VFLTAFIMFLIAAGAAVASEPQVTLAPGTWQIVEFTNAENEQENLDVTNISAPPEILPYVVVSPSSVPANSSENVVIQFAYIPLTIRQAVPQDTFAVSISGIVVYLDLSVPLPENAENRWAELEARIVALQASFTEQMEGIAARITALESVEQENWEPEFEALWENLIRVEDWMTSNFHQIAELWDAMPENSPSVDVLLWQTMLGDVENELRGEQEWSSNQLRLDYEAQIAKVKKDAESDTMMWSIGSALAVLCGVGGYFGIKKKFRDVPEKILEKTHRRKTPKHGEITPEV